MHTQRPPRYEERAVNRLIPAMRSGMQLMDVRRKRSDELSELLTRAKAIHKKAKPANLETAVRARRQEWSPEAAAQSPAQVAQHAESAAVIERVVVRQMVALMRPVAGRQGCDSGRERRLGGSRMPTSWPRTCRSSSRAEFCVGAGSPTATAIARTRGTARTPDIAKTPRHGTARIPVHSRTARHGSRTWRRPSARTSGLRLPRPGAHARGTRTPRPAPAGRRGAARRLLPLARMQQPLEN